MDLVVVSMLLGCGTDSPPMGEDSTGSMSASSSDGADDSGTGQTSPPLQCEALPLAALDAAFSAPLEITGLNPANDSTLTVSGLPDGLTFDPGTGIISGAPQGDPGSHPFEVLVETMTVLGPASTMVPCVIDINPRLALQMPLGTPLGCVSPDDGLADAFVDGTGDGTAPSCELQSEGEGNGRVPQGVEIDASTCQITGSISEERRGTWVFIVRAQQSGVELFVPYCVTNDEPQGYEITATHSGTSDAELRPIVRTYDPGVAFDVGMDGDPRYEVTSPETCDLACFYRYAFLRTIAPLEDFSLEPEGLVMGEMDQPIGFFHELRVSGPAVPPEFQARPWVVSVAVEYCMSTEPDGCDDVIAQGDGALELALVMLPVSG